MQDVTDPAEATQRHLPQTGTDRITDNQRSANDSRRNRHRQHHHEMRTSIKQDTAKYELNHLRIVDAANTISHRACTIELQSIFVFAEFCSSSYHVITLPWKNLCDTQKQDEASAVGQFLPRQKAYQKELAIIRAREC